MGFRGDKFLGSGSREASGGVGWQLHAHSALPVHPGLSSISARLWGWGDVSGTILGSGKYLDS